MNGIKPPLRQFNRDDGDIDDLVEELEKIYQVDFGSPEAQDVNSVDELHEYITERIEFPDESTGICLSAVTFYRVRKALVRLTERTDLRPKTELKDLIQGFNERVALKKFWQDLENITGLKMPQLVYWFQRRFPWFGPEIPESCQTVGDLANMAFAFNYRALARERASYRRSDVRKSLWLILGDWHPWEKQRITGATRFH